MAGNKRHFEQDQARKGFYDKKGGGMARQIPKGQGPIIEQRPKGLCHGENNPCYYFAYGSNMSFARLRARIPGATRLGVCRLPGYRLIFHKIGQDGTAKCDALATGLTEDMVYGVLYRLSCDEIAALDVFEGRGRGYKRVQVAVLDEKNIDILAEIYLATAVDAGLKPFLWYKTHVLMGAREAGLPKEYQEEIERIETIADGDSKREAKEASLYGGLDLKKR